MADLAFRLFVQDLIQSMANLVAQSGRGANARLTVGQTRALGSVRSGLDLRANCVQESELRRLAQTQCPRRINDGTARYRNRSPKRWRGSTPQYVEYVLYSVAVSDPRSTHRTQVIDFPHANLWLVRSTPTTSVQIALLGRIELGARESSVAGFSDSVVWNPPGTDFGTPKMRGHQRLRCQTQLVGRNEMVLNHFRRHALCTTCAVVALER